MHVSPVLAGFRPKTCPHEYAGSARPEVDDHASFCQAGLAFLRVKVMALDAAEQLFLDFSPTETSVVRAFSVERIPHELAKQFIEQWHYSKNCPTGQNYFFGAFIGSELYAVADYGVGANMDGGKSLAGMTGLPVTRRNHVTLKRLCRKGAKGEARIAMTRFLSLCHKLLKHENGVRFIVSYADPTENGTITPVPRTTPWQCGGIYAAANFRYLGKVPPERHFKDRTGVFVHRRVPYRLMKRRKAAGAIHTTMPQAQKELGLTPWTMQPKERWFIDLGEVRSSRKGKLMAKIGPKEQRARELREARANKPKGVRRVAAKSIGKMARVKGSRRGG